MTELTPPAKKLFKEEGHDADNWSTTPKKSGIFQELPRKGEPRIKFKYTVIEKPTGWGNFPCLMLILLVLLGGFVWISYEQKLETLELISSEEQKNCKQDFIVNK